MDSTTPFQPWTANESAINVKIEGELVDDARLCHENVIDPKHTQTASIDKDNTVVSVETSGPATVADPEVIVSPKESNMDAEKVASMQHIVENTLSPEERQRVGQLLVAVDGLTGPERLLLYLRLPTGVPPHDPLKVPINPLGSRAELQQTVTWIQTHLEVDPDVSLPKQDVYDEYIAFCLSSNMKPLSTADFGKVMKQVYPTVRPRRLGTRGNSRYCYAGLRKKIKLEVPQLPDLGESSKDLDVSSPRKAERVVCDWAESKLGVKFAGLADLSQHLQSVSLTTPLGPTSGTPPPMFTTVSQSGSGSDDTSSRQLMKQLKRKIQTQSAPGRPKKNKGQELTGESSPSTSYLAPQPIKHESEHVPDPSYGYSTPYMPMYDVRPPYASYGVPPRAHPPHIAPPHSMPLHDYRSEHYSYEPTYASPRDLSVPCDTTHNLPINLSSDASLDLSTERSEWQRRRPPEPPPARQSLPGKKLILETYQSETQSSTPRVAQSDVRSVLHATDEFSHSEYLPKKMRAAEILGGKLAASRQTLLASEAVLTSTSSNLPSGSEPPQRSEVAFLEDPKNATSRSISTAAALVREELEAASPTQPVKAPTPKPERKARRSINIRAKPNLLSTGTHERSATPDTCCGLDGINIKTGVICDEKHSEILNRERVISICNIGKHDLDDYLNEGSSQEHEEELLQYFQRDSEAGTQVSTHDQSSNFLDTGDPHDDHSQGKSEKLSQLRELLAKNLKSQSRFSSQNITMNQNQQYSTNHGINVESNLKEGAFKPVSGINTSESLNGPMLNLNESNINNKTNTLEHNRHMSLSSGLHNNINPIMTNSHTHLYNGTGQHTPQSPKTRAQQYDFVPISEGCHSPGNFHAKSPLGFNLRSHSPSKIRKTVMTGGSLQTSPISHSTAASPFVSPRNTPVPRSRLCSRPIPKHNGRRRRNLLSIGMNDHCPKQFAMPNDQTFVPKTSPCSNAIKYCQPMSAPPSPNILCTQHKNQMYHSGTGNHNGSTNLCLTFLPSTHFRENMNGEHTQPLSADPLSSEVSQFFQEPVMMPFSSDTTFRSQSVPLKQGMGNVCLLSYNNTPVGSVPPTPVPNEFCDFGSLAETCDIAKACLNPETLDKIYDAIDSSNGVLDDTSTNLLHVNGSLTNGCEEQMSDVQLNSLLPNNTPLMERNSQYNHAYTENNHVDDNVEDFFKRTNSIEYDLSDIETEKSKYCLSRSVPSTPLPYKRVLPSLQLNARRSTTRELFADDSYAMPNGISSKSVPSTPQLSEERNIFSYSNRDFLINGNSVDTCTATPVQDSVVDNSETLESPLHDMLREDVMLESLTPAADLLADLDKMEGTPYVDL